MATRAQKLLAWLVAVGAFAASMLAAVAIVPYALGLLSGCFPPSGSCGDGVGWAFLIASPVWVPLTLVVSAIFAALAYSAVVRIGRPTQ